MLPRIVLFALQLLAAWYLVPVIKGALPVLVVGPFSILVDALLYGLIVVIVGYAGSRILKEVPSPTGVTFVVSLLLAFLLAGLTLVPQISLAIEGVVPVLARNRFLYPLVGALVGYYLKR